MFSHAEVILWDEFGGRDWWLARKSLKFSDSLIHKGKIIQEQFQLTDQPYMAIHMRRGDFFWGREEKAPSIKKISKEINSSKFMTIFVATDASDQGNCMHSFRMRILK